MKSVEHKNDLDRLYIEGEMLSWYNAMLNIQKSVADYGEVGSYISSIEIPNTWDLTQEFDELLKKLLVEKNYKAFNVISYFCDEKIKEFNLDRYNWITTHSPEVDYVFKLFDDIKNRIFYGKRLDMTIPTVIKSSITYLVDLPIVYEYLNRLVFVINNEKYFNELKEIIK